MPSSSRPIRYGFGLQSGGSTLVSYCLLQRADCTGVLDEFHDRLPDPPDPLPRDAIWWGKSTVVSFRATEALMHLENLGHPVLPVLIVRDVRQTWDSLIGKSYGRNSLTAEDPPIRLRFARFHADWLWFRDNGLAILKFEDFVATPETVLRRACDGLRLPWDPAMMSWPKPPMAVWNGMAASRSLLRSLGGDLKTTLDRRAGASRLSRIAREDLDWLEDGFADFNRHHGYPEQVDRAGLDGLPDAADRPKLDVANRYRRIRRSRMIRRMTLPIANLLQGLGRPAR